MSIPAVPAAWSVTTIAFTGIVSLDICWFGGTLLLWFFGAIAPRILDFCDFQPADFRALIASRDWCPRRLEACDGSLQRSSSDQVQPWRGARFGPTFPGIPSSAPCSEQRRFRSNTLHALRQILPRNEAEEVYLGLYALVDGFWIPQLIDPESFTMDDARGREDVSLLACSTGFPTVARSRHVPEEFAHERSIAEGLRVDIADVRVGLITDHRDGANRHSVRQLVSPDLCRAGTGDTRRPAGAGTVCVRLRLGCSFSLV
ncbi:TetR family transcriptional regulator C-terminal domain-containing protein [Mesorhizobium sp. 2RAF45]|uniref:TetR family transcriptional regulator C-terminal domain-containing protein n=1 Tax=Mesorhizobium sp. 2RAF45 TaxID=3233001 RepID=UPI003F9E0C81